MVSLRGAMSSVMQRPVKQIQVYIQIYYLIYKDLMVEFCLLLLGYWFVLLLPYYRHSKICVKYRLEDRLYTN